MARPILTRRTLTEQAADHIASKIISGAYPGGSQIRQDAIASELGLSRIPVREALLKLEADGLVNIISHRGAVVAELTAEDAVDLFEARALLEPHLLRIAIKSATEENIRTIESVHDQYTATVENSGDPETLSHLNWELHSSLLGPSKRRRSLALVASLHSSADRYLRLQIKPEAAQRKAIKDHRAILDAYRVGNASEAARVFKKHIVEASREILKVLKATAN